ncbi:MAG: MBL fold metallo-hydrolase [Burkholderiaceae bacterium]|jgi:metallo-beta-lactamase class B
MYSRSSVLATALGLILSALSVLALGQTADPAEVDAAITKATRIAGDDMKAPLELCKTATQTSELSEEQMHVQLANMMANSYVPPARVFDNLYFLGTSWVSAWALVTPRGIVLFDALDNDQEAKDSIEGGLTKLGLNPSDIRFIVVTHAHGDHYGGVNYLVQRYHPKVIMSRTDWAELDKPNLQFDDPNWGRPPKRDIAVEDGYKLKLGGESVKLFVTAGHTPGTLSAEFRVRENGRPSNAILWGGTSFNFGKIPERLLMYIASSDRFEARTKSDHLEVLLSNHARFDQTFDKLKVLQASPGGPNPYVIGEDATRRFFAIAGLCARATLASFDAEALKKRPNPSLPRPRS